MVTVLGLITLVMVAGAWLFRRDALQYILGVAAVLPQSAGLVVGDKGFPVFYLALALIAVLGIPRLLMALARPAAADEALRPRRRVVDVLAVGLVAWAGVITFAGPRVFAGLPVFDPSLGVDVQVDALTPLAPTLGNTAQLGYLVLAAVFLLFAGRLFPVDRRVAGVLVWATVLLAGARLALGTAWPLELFQTMPGLPYQNGDRLAGTFYEPSVLGMYLTAAAGYFSAHLLARQTRTGTRVAALAGLALVVVEFVANGSGTALVGLALVAAVGAVAVLAGVLRSRRLRLRPVLIAAGLAVAGAGITQVPALLGYALGMVETKTESWSWVARGASNTRSVEIVLDTLGLGVGLGGNRPSSLPLFVVSCLGVPGSALLVAIVVVAIIRALRTGRHAALWTLVGALTAGAVAVPDLSTPLIWVALAACIGPTASAINPTVNPVWAATGSPAVRTRRPRRVPERAPTLDAGFPQPEGIDMPRTPLSAPSDAPDVRIGCDVHPVAQTAESIALFGPRYLHRVFTSAELEQCAGDVERLAVRFAAKEAVLKVLQPEPDDAVPWSAIEVRNVAGGAPYVVLDGPARELAERRGVPRIGISMSHDAGVGMAVAAAVPAVVRQGVAGQAVAGQAGS